MTIKPQTLNFISAIKNIGRPKLDYNYPNRISQSALAGVTHKPELLKRVLHRKLTKALDNCKKRNLLDRKGQNLLGG